MDIFTTDKKLDSRKVFDRMKDFIKIRLDMDQAIIAAIQSIPEEAFLKKFEIEFGAKKLDLELWKLLFQWFNHQTHHRGQISVQLDLLGIDNDYSLVLDKID